MHRSLLGLAAATAAAALSAGCGVGPLNAEARDTWTRTYPLSSSGEVSVTNVNGRVDVEGVAGSTVEVQAERIARGATDQLARDLLPKIQINEHTRPDLVSVETARINGMLIGASFEVDYHVKAPATASVRIVTVNGRVQLRGIAGRASVRTTNGPVEATNLSGAFDGRTVNGRVRAQFASLGKGDVSAATVNGPIDLLIPATAKAAVNATWVNGRFHASGVTFDVRDDSKRHFEGVLNGGGTAINATTVNGGVTVGTREDAPASQ